MAARAFCRLLEARGASRRGLRECDVLQIPAEEAQVGDRVAAPVRDESGRVLLPVGARLSPAVLSRLGGWGVREIAVERDGATGGKSAEDIIGELEHRFADHQDDALMMRIKAVAHRHIDRRR